MTEEQKIPYPDAQEPRQKTDEELRQLCIDVFGGQVFTDRHCNSPQDVGMVFMVAGLGGLNDAKEVAMIYEYLSQAGPRSINGMPMFMSLQMLNQADFNVWLPMYMKYAKQQEEFLSGG